METYKPNKIKNNSFGKKVKIALAILTFLGVIATTSCQKGGPLEPMVDDTVETTENEDTTPDVDPTPTPDPVYTTNTSNPTYTIPKSNQTHNLEVAVNGTYNSETTEFKINNQIVNDYTTEPDISYYKLKKNLGPGNYTVKATDSDDYNIEDWVVKVLSENTKDVFDTEADYKNSSYYNPGNETMNSSMLSRVLADAYTNLSVNAQTFVDDIKNGTHKNLAINNIQTFGYNQVNNVAFIETYDDVHHVIDDVILTPTDITAIHNTRKMIK